MIRPLIGVGAQAVVDVNGPDRMAALAGQIEQDAGVDPAAEPHRQRVGIAGQCIEDERRRRPRHVVAHSRKWPRSIRRW